MRRLIKSEMHILRSRRLAGCRRNILFFIMMKMMEKLANSPMTMIKASTGNAIEPSVRNTDNFGHSDTGGDWQKCHCSLMSQYLMIFSMRRPF